jgi:hypothetical protein
MTDTITTDLPKHLADMANACDRLDEELAAALGRYERLTEAEERIVAALQNLAQARNDRARNRVLEQLRPHLSAESLPAALVTSGDIHQLGNAASDALKRLIAQEEVVEREVHSLSARRDGKAREFAEAAHSALLAEPGLRPALRKVMGLTDGGRP